MKRIAYLLFSFLALASISSAQVGWKDLGSGSQLKGAAFKPGLYGALVDCPHAGAPYCAAPANTFAFAGKEEYVMAAQSGCAIDKIHNHMTCTGGGHNDYFGNQVYDFDMATGVITRLTDPSQVSTYSFTQWTLDGLPAASHTGQGLVYMPVEDAVFKMAIGVDVGPHSQIFVWWMQNQRTAPTWTSKYANPAMFPFLMGSGASGCTPNSLQLGTLIGGGGSGATFTVLINGSGVPTGYGSREATGSGYTSLPTTATITTCTGTETLSGGQVAGGGIWNGGDQGSMWVLDTSTYNPDVPSSESIIGVSLTTNKMYRYTPSLDTGPGGSNPWTTLSSLSTIPTYGTCRINPAVRPAVLVCVGAQVTGFAAGGIYAAPLSGSGSFQFTNITSQTTGCSNLYSVVNPGFEFDDSTGLFVGFAGTGNSVTLFDYTSLTCVTRQFSGGPTNAVTISPTGAGYDRALAYFPKLNTFLLAPNGLNHMFTLKFHADGQGHSTLTCEDFDGDGYGVGPGCTGPDADDTDPTVNTTATVLAKYGNIQTFLEHMGVQNASSLATVYCVQAGGSGSTPSTNADTACTTPYPAFNNLPTLSVPYIVLFRNGTYTATINGPPSGTAAQSNFIMAYPGEQPFMDMSGGSLIAFSTVNKAYITVDGFKIKASASNAGYATGTFVVYPGTGPIVNFWNALYRCEIFNGGGDSNVDGNNMIRMDAEQLVLHDPFTGGGQHNFYMGANTVPSSGIAIRRSIMYNVATGGFPNLQLNGRCTQCYVEQNVIYNSDGQAFALLSGVTNSFVRNNLIFNTGTHISGSARSMSIIDYDSGQCRVNAVPSICAWDQTGNVIANNTLWVGTLGFDGSGTINPSYAVRISNATTSSTTCNNGSTGPCVVNIGGNFWYNNIIVGLSSDGNARAPVLYDSTNPANYLASDTWHNNIIQNSAGFSTIVASEGGTGLTCATFNSGALSGSGCSTSNPLFINSATTNATTPTNFNFKLQASSPAIGAGTAVWFPALDNTGAVSATTPFLGTFTPSQAQPSITITSPTANQVIAGFTGFNFTATVANAPSAYCMAWQVDAYLPVGSSCVKAPFTLFHNTFMELNGTHTVTAILKDALGNTITTATQTFSIANTWPIAAGIGMTVATGTPLASLWSGTVSVTPTITGPDATHSKDTTWFVDGVSIFKDPGDLAASPTFSIDTTQFTNGQHIVAVEVRDNFGGISYGSDNFYVGSALEWSQPVTFANAAATMELRTNMREVFLPPNGTFQLTATLYNTDGSTTSTTPVYNSENTAAVTVTSGGLLTGQTPVAFNPAMSRVDVMAPLVSGTDLVCQNHTNCNSGYLSATHPMTQQNVGQMITIPSGAGTWVAGTYYIQSVQSNGSGAFTMMSCTGTSSVCSNANPGANQSVATSFQTGPTETVFAMVTTTAPNPPIYHFDCTNGAILSSYTAGHSCYWISAFNGTAGFPYTLAGGIGGDQTYSTGFSSGYVQDLVNAGFTAIETSPGAQPSASTTESAYSGGGGTIPTLVSNYQAAVSGTNLHYVLIGDAWLKNSGPGTGWGTGGLSQTTRATYSPAWTTTPWTHVLNAWNGTAFTVEACDECSDFGNNPFEGPINFASGLQIVATGGGGSGESCSVTGNFILSSLRHFVISGSSITNLNSATGTFYIASQANTPFTFTCANVADGTYNSTNNPTDALLLEPYVSSWFNATDGTATSVNDYLRYTMFTNIRSQFTSATSGRPNVTFPAIGGAGCANVYGFANPANGLADYATHYYTQFNIGYLGGRNAVRGVIHGSNANGLNTYDLNVSGGIGIMNPARADFGCYSASAPLINQNSTVTNNYGLQGYTPNGSGTATGPNQDGTNSGVTNVTSFSGNTLTLNTDHLLRQIYPGITRIQLSAMSTSGDVGNYYIIGWPDTTHLTLANATTDFLIQFTTLSGTITSGATTFTVADASTWNSGPPWIANIGGELISCTTLASNVFSGCTRGFGTGLPAAGHTSGATVGLGGGTITFSNGDTKNLSTITAKQLNSCTNPASGNPAVVCGDTFSYTGSTDQTILRHRGMTFTISGTSNSNLNSRTFYYNAENPGPVAANTQNFYREIPNGSSTSGTATIIAAQDYVPGRQGGTQSFYDPDVAFAGQIAGFYERGAGTRVYSIAFNQNGYSATSGILNGVTPQQPSLFNYLCIDASCVETGYSGIQAYSHPHWRSLYQAENFHAVALANLLHQRLASYWLTTSLNSPDMGGNFECTARSGAKGKSVGCMNTTNAPQTISFVTTPYLQSGQNFGQFIANSQAILFSTVAAGTSPAVATVPAGGEVVWVFPATFANEFSQPTISVQPSDVTNAASVIVEYGYDQFLLDIGASTVSCSTGPSCTLPVDRNIGPVYYRLIYMNSSNAVISIGDIQTL